MSHGTIPVPAHSRHRSSSGRESLETSAEARPCEGAASSEAAEAMAEEPVKIRSWRRVPTSFGDVLGSSSGVGDAAREGSLDAKATLEAYLDLRDVCKCKK